MKEKWLLLPCPKFRKLLMGINERILVHSCKAGKLNLFSELREGGSYVDSHFGQELANSETAVPLLLTC